MLKSHQEIWLKDRIYPACLFYFFVFCEIIVVIGVLYTLFAMVQINASNLEIQDHLRVMMSIKCQ